jgi:hypothetical protein
LIAEDGGEHQQHEKHGAAHIAAATTATGTLRLEIGILNFGQRLFLSAVLERNRSFYGNGSGGSGLPVEQAGDDAFAEAEMPRSVAAAGTGSNPPGLNG